MSSITVMEEERNSSINSTGVETLFQTYPTSLLYFTATCCIAFTIFGIFGNSLTILALLKSPLMKNATSVFIINLCIVDGLYCSFSFPLAASTMIHKSWPFSDSLCKFYPMVRYSNVALSLFTVIAITINRYVIIVHSKSYDKIYTKTTIAAIIICIWIGSFLLLTPTALGVWGEFGFSYEVSLCTILEKNGKSPKRFLYAFAFLFPSLVFIYCYTRIFLTVRKSERQVRSDYGSVRKEMEKKSFWKKLFCFRDNEEETDLSVEGRKKKKKLTKDLRLLRMILVIFIIFLISYTPIVFVKLFKKEKDLPVLAMFAYLGIYSTAIVNPIIYVLMSKEYRKAYLNLFIKSEKTNFSSTSNT
ncbi:protein trapped in endoderm-1-like [Centruroides sculpturatus]|uniref:protein trapped in endoderm-1-like n=1 Tax=Centruroides sculpturatus TaxID=218467 RepID=UPI000C6DF3CC|nr:protein trapped in endoderm-1-like [Centruroides sculpturatus]